MGGHGHGIQHGRVVGHHGNKVDHHQPVVAQQTIAPALLPLHGTHHSNVRGTRVKALATNTTGENFFLKNPKNLSIKI